jgi:hypothetical protein
MNIGNTGVSTAKKTENTDLIARSDGNDADCGGCLARNEEEKEFTYAAGDVNVIYNGKHRVALKDFGDDGDDECCASSLDTCSASLAETEEDFDHECAEDGQDGVNDGDEGKGMIRSPITRSQFPVGFGHDVLYFPKEGEKGNFTEL